MRFRLVTVAGIAGVLAAGLGSFALSSPAQVAAVEADAPAPRIDPALVEQLTVDGMPPLACGFAPIDVLVAEPGAENADTVEARELQVVIAETQGSMSPQKSRDWVEMWRRDGTIMYGHRTGPVGIGQVLGVEHAADSFTFGGSFDCGPVGYRDGRMARPLGYNDRGEHLEVIYGGGTCDTRPWEARVRETDRYVDLLLLSPPPLEGECVGMGTTGRTRAELERPLGGRTVRNVGYVPAQIVLSEAEEAARAAAAEVAAREADGSVPQRAAN